MKNWPVIAQVMAVVSVLSVLLSIYGAFSASDIWLAPTQWLLVAAVSGVWAVWAKTEK